MGTLEQGDLKKYIEYIKDMEGHLFEQNRAMRSLKQQLVNVNDSSYYTPYVEKIVKEDDNQKIGIVVFFSGVISFAVMGMILGPIIWAVIRFIIYTFSGNLLSQAFAYFWDGVFGGALKQGFFGGIAIGVVIGIVAFVLGVVSDVNTSIDLKNRKKIS